MVKVALIQMTSGPAVEGNLLALESYIREAAENGAEFILTPENTCHMRSPATEKLKSSLSEADHIMLPRLSALAKELKVWISLGSISVLVAPDKIANRSYLINSNGDIVAKYDKVHLFDVDLPTGESHRESNIVQGGGHVVVADSPWGKIGLSICYDLRFAYLYRKMAQAGADIILVPAAFTVPTGQAHWQVLLRARAIETGCFVLAAAQTGEHDGGRKTYGHSLVAGPWGDVIAESDDAPGILYADLDMAAVEKARAAIPCLKHDREIV